MKKIGILTIYDEDNYGNRLQNYAVQETLKSMGFDVETIKYDMDYTLSIVKPGKRLDCFHKFNEMINFAPDKYILSQYSEIKEDFDSVFDYIVVGSDQIWNYTFEALFADKVFASFVDKSKRVSLSASIGVTTLPKLEERYDICRKYLPEMAHISVREFAGKDIIQKICGRDDVEVLVDPTMLLTKEKWNDISIKPDFIADGEKYILKYFLDDKDEDSKRVLEEFAKENDCKIIDIIDPNSKYREMGPSEFLYLIKNAKLVITDSFHCCIFSLLFHKPFIIHKRDRKDNINMYSRMETLIRKFDLKNVEYTGKLDKSIFEVDEDKIEEKLAFEREKAKNYLERALKHD